MFEVFLNVEPRTSNFGLRKQDLAPFLAQPHNVDKGEWHGIVRSCGGLTQRVYAGSD
jgi:hypothetical protein